jgi:outer membrane lipopolysaccharide assembly protein LptE/RlpB
MMRPVSMAAVRRGGTIALAATVLLAGCGPTFQQMSEVDCAGIATDTAYEACQRRLARQLADERLGYIVRSQVVH